MSNQARTALLAVLGASACTVDLTVPADARVQCTGDGQCPSGSTCSPSAHVCILDSKDAVAPSLTGSPSWLSASGTFGASLTVSFVASEALLDAPRVGLNGDFAGFGFELVASDGNGYSYARRLDGTEAEGSLPVRAALTDRAGNVALVDLGAVTVDFTAPRVRDVSWLAPAGKVAIGGDEQVAFTAHTDETPAAVAARLTDLAGRTVVTAPTPTVSTEASGFAVSGTIDVPQSVLVAGYVELEVVVTDGMGNSSAPAASRSGPIPVDIVGPSGATIAIRGKPLVRDSQALVDLAVVGATEVLVQGDVLGTPAWQPLDLSKPVTVALTPGIGLKSIGAQFRDEAWNTCDVVLDTVYFDPTIDVVAPQVTSARSMSATGVFVTFNEPMAAGVEAATSYTVTGGAAGTLGVVSAQVDPSGLRVLLTTAAQNEAGPFTVHVGGVKDLAGNTVDPLHADAAFVGFGARDTSPPLLFSPADGESVSAPRLVWSERFGAETYRVEVYGDAGMSTPALAPIITSQTFVEPSLAPGHTYYWRARTESPTPSGFSAVASFGVVTDTLYVSCPPASSCAATGQGTVERPFTRIGSALDVARRYPGTTWSVLIADRGGVPYDEALVVPPGVRLLGGYDQAFVRGTSSRTAITSASIATVQLEGVRSAHPVLLERLALANTSVRDGYTLYAFDSDAGLSVVDCTIAGVSSPGTSVAVYLGNCGTSAGGGPLFSRVDIVGGTTTTQDSVALVSRSSAPTLSDCTLRGGDLSAPGYYSTSSAVRASGGGLTAAGSTFTTGSGATGNRIAVDASWTTVDITSSTLRADGLGIFVIALSPGSGRVASSVLISGRADGSIGNQSCAVRAWGSLAIVSSTLLSGDTGDPNTLYNALQVQPGAQVQVTDSMLLVRGGRYPSCVHMLDATSHLISFQNNLLVGCTSAIYDHTAGGPTGNCPWSNYRMCEGESALNDASILTQGTPASVSSNIGMSTVPTLADIAFRDLSTYDLRLSGSSPASITRGGKDPTGNTCGASASAPCGGTSTDRAGAARPGADGYFTIGAFEP